MNVWEGTGDNGILLWCFTVLLLRPLLGNIVWVAWSRNIRHWLLLLNMWYSTWMLYCLHKMRMCCRIMPKCRYEICLFSPLLEGDQLCAGHLNPFLGGSFPLREMTGVLCDRIVNQAWIFHALWLRELVLCELSFLCLPFISVTDCKSCHFNAALLVPRLICANVVVELWKQGLRGLMGSCSSQNTRKTGKGRKVIIRVYGQDVDMRNIRVLWCQNTELRYGALNASKHSQGFYPCCFVLRLVSQAGRMQKFTKRMF